VAAWTGVYVWPHTDRSVATATVDANEGLHQLVDLLEDRGVERISGSYWRVLTVEYATDREIIGAVSPPDAIRFPERQREVEATPPDQVTFVFPVGADQPDKLWMPVHRYERLEVGNSVVYLPLPTS
jgi:hypothetical protein